MRCFLCKVKGPPEGTETMFRVNEKGQPGVWACGECIKKTDATVDPEVKRITQILETRTTRQVPSGPTTGPGTRGR